MNWLSSPLLPFHLLLLLVLAAPGQVHPMQTWPASQPGPGISGRPESTCDLGVNRSGDGILVWRSRLQLNPTPTYEVWAQPLRRGEIYGAPVLLDTFTDLVTTSELTRVRADIDEEGSWVAVWDASSSVNGWLGIRARRFHAPSGALGPLLIVSPTETVNHTQADVAVGPWPGETDTSFYLVWQRGTQAGQSAIRIRRYRVDVSGLGPPTDVADAIQAVNSEPTSNIGGQDRPAVVVDGQGVVTVVWERYEQWGPGSPYWRIMLRRRSGSTWLTVWDPSAPGAINGFDATDYEVSSVGSPAATTSQRTPPRATVAGDGRVLVAWKRLTGAPYGFRSFAPGPGTSATPGAQQVHLPAIWSPGFGSFDVAWSTEGSILLAWESMITSTAGSGRIVLSRIHPGTISAIEEIDLDSTTGLAISGITLDAADTGLVETAWTRGFGPNLQRLWRRRADLDLVARIPNPGGPPLLEVTALALGGLEYHLWPLSTGGTALEYGLSPVGDGRLADLSLADPLLQWHLSLGGTHAIMPNAIGTLASDGTAQIPVHVPAGLPPIPLRWTLLVHDPNLPWPAALPLFTQPELIALP